MRFGVKDVCKFVFSRGGVFLVLIKMFPVRLDEPVSPRSLFVRYIDYSLSGCCFSRVDLTCSDKVWWSVLVAKWCVIFFAFSLGLITLSWEDLPRNLR